MCFLWVLSYSPKIMNSHDIYYETRVWFMILWFFVSPGALGSLSSQTPLLGQPQVAPQFFLASQPSASASTGATTGGHSVPVQQILIPVSTGTPAAFISLNLSLCLHINLIKLDWISCLRIWISFWKNNILVEGVIGGFMLQSCGEQIIFNLFNLNIVFDFTHIVTHWALKFRSFLVAFWYVKDQ